MRHPLLRILMAMLVGLWSPVCCCQAMVLAGNACTDSPIVASKPHACCPSCQDEPAPSEEVPPADDQNSFPGKCPSCPTCHGAASGMALAAESKIPAFEWPWDLTPMLALAAAGSRMQPAGVVVTAKPPWSQNPPSIRANRDALRWHCALTV